MNLHSAIVILLIQFTYIDADLDTLNIRLSLLVALMPHPFYIQA